MTPFESLLKKRSHQFSYQVATGFSFGCSRTMFYRLLLFEKDHLARGVALYDCALTSGIRPIIMTVVKGKMSLQGFPRFFINLHYLARLSQGRW